jgi:hypothetical protein
MKSFTEMRPEKEKELSVVSRKKIKFWELISHVKVIKKIKLTVDKLRLLITYKKTREDAAKPSPHLME